MLDVEGLQVAYGRVQALHDVTLRVGAGEMVALFGANGAGKTTTLRAISGLVPIRGGSVSFGGSPITGMRPEHTARAGIAHIPEGRGIFPQMTVRQNLKMGAYVARLEPEALDAALGRGLELFPRLRERLEQQAGTMSGGEQQMLAIARALMASPTLLMLDEPSHGLAPKVVQEVFVLLAGLREQGMSVLVVEQFASVALSVVNRGYVLDRGRIALAGSADELRTGRGLAEVYLGS